MRAAHFVQRYPPALGGSEAYFARLSEYLVRRGVDVNVFTTNAHDLEAFWSRTAKRVKSGIAVDDGVKLHRYPLWHIPEQRAVLRLLSLLPLSSWQLLTTSCNPLSWRMLWDCLIPRQTFDIVHVASFPYGWPLYCGMTLAHRLKVPLVVTPFLHIGDPADRRDSTRRAYTSPALLSVLHAAQRVFVQTEIERSTLLEHGVAAEKLVLQGMGVDRTRCVGGDRKQARQQWRIEPNELVVGHLANKSVQKGTVDLLRAAALAWQAGKRFRLVLAGPEMANFRSFWRSFQGTPAVVNLGVLNEQQKRDFFAGIDVFAMPSRSDSFGLVFLEAWANGVPSVAYRAGGVPGVIRDGVDGLLVRCGDLPALAEALVRLCDDNDMRRRLGNSGKERLEHDFRWEDKLELVHETYRELTGT